MKRIHQSWFLVAAYVGVIVGTVLGLKLRISFFDSWLWVLAAGMVFVVCYLRPRAFLLVFMVCAGMILAFYRCSSELIGEDYVRQFTGKTITVSGVIDGDPTTDESGTKFKLRDLKFGEMEAARVEGEWAADSAVGGERAVGDEVEAENERMAGDNQAASYAAEGKMYVSMGKNEKLARGDRMVLTGKMDEGFGTYVGFMSRPVVKQWARPSPGDWVLNVRNWFAERVRKRMPEEEANLGLSYLLGMKSGLSDELEENLRMVGLTHIVVASGAHLSILIEIARKFFGKMSKFVGIGASLIFIGFFMALVGWTPSIMRAGLMSGLAILVSATGRKFASWRIILLAMAVTLLIDPMFVGDLGWLLSFASYIGITFLGPLMTKYFYGENKPKFIARTIITTLAATIMTLPITLYYFGTVSFIAVIPNLLILPTLPYAMGLVFLIGVMAEIKGLGPVVGFLATKMLDFHIETVGFFGKMKSFLIEITPEQSWVFLLYIIVVIPVVIGFFNRRRRRRKEEQRFSEEEWVEKIFWGARSG